MQLWYPSSDPLNGATAPYREDQTRTHWLQVFDRSRLTVTHAHTDAALSTEVATWPLILYVPSWDGQPTDNTVQSEELASHGFVVAALEAVDPGSAMDFSTQAGYQNTVSRAEARIVEGAAALTQALDQLTCLTADASGGRWVGRVDFGRVGVFGYSFGGAVAAEAAASDQRLRAIANLDGWLFGNAASLGVRQPFMTIADGGELTIVEDHSPAKPAGSDRQHINYYALFDHDKAYQLINGLAKNGGYYLTIAGMEHPKFSDAPLFAPRTLQRTSHGLAQRHAEAIINAYLVAFFDQALLGRTVPLLATKSAFDPMAVLHTYSTVGVADRDTRAVSATATAPCVK